MINSRVFVLSLIKRELAMLRSSAQVQVLSLCSVLLVLQFSWRFLFGAPMPQQVLQFIFKTVLLVGGSIAASLAFQEAHRPLGSALYYMLPADMHEKYLAKLVIYGPLYALVAVLCFVVAGLAMLLISLALWQEGLPLFNPLAGANLSALLLYASLFPVFFAAGIWFRRQAFLQAVLWLGLFAMLAGILAGIISAAALWRAVQPLMSELQGSYNFEFGHEGWRRAAPSGDGAAELARRLYWRVALPVFFVILGYIRLTENEVEHGA